MPNEQYSSSEKICFVYRVITWTTPLSSPYPKSHTFVPSCHVEQKDIFKLAQFPRNTDSSPSLLCTTKLLLTSALEIGMKEEGCTESGILDPLLISRDTKDSAWERSFSRAFSPFMTNLGPQKFCPRHQSSLSSQSSRMVAETTTKRNLTC